MQPQQILPKKCDVSKQPKTLPDIQTILKTNFVAKNFQKQPNLVALLPTQKFELDPMSVCILNITVRTVLLRFGVHLTKPERHFYKWDVHNLCFILFLPFEHSVQKCSTIKFRCFHSNCRPLLSQVTTWRLCYSKICKLKK